MRKFKVTGTVTITVEKEVCAVSEEAAIYKMEDDLQYLTEYANGTVGADDDDVTLIAGGMIQWNEAELISDDGVFECPECGEECERRYDSDGDLFWECLDCESKWSDDGDELPAYYGEEDYE